MFGATPPGFEALVARELDALGASKIRVRPGGVGFRGNLALLAKANLWSRVATRFLIRVSRFRADRLADLQGRAARVPWECYIDRTTRVGVHATCRKSRIYHSGAAAERVAGGIAARLGWSKPPSARGGSAPTKGEEQAVLVRIEHDRCQISVDSSGPHLHRRGYKLESVEAPLRENLAAGMLMLADWDGTEALIDPMCGSGTLICEAAAIAAGAAPGLARSFAFMGWPVFDAAPWEQATEEAIGLRRAVTVPLLAYDRSQAAVRAARANIQAAGLGDAISIARATLDDVVAAAVPQDPTLIACNPPYGRRMGRQMELESVYGQIGALVRRHPSCRLALLTAEPRLARSTGLKFAWTSERFPHGGLQVQLFVTQRRA